MTQDEIVEMAREAGVSIGKRFEGGRLVECLTLEVQTFAKLVAAKEREACVIAGFHACLSQDDAVRVREAIRARGQ